MELRRRHVHANSRLHAQRALIALAALAYGAATAAAQVSVEVSPLRMELQAGPGSTTTQPITLRNAGTTSVRVRATLTDWDLARDGAPQFEGSMVGGPYSATAWTRLAPPEQVIEPGAQATVRFSLAVPAGIAPGGYRTGVLFEFAPAAADPATRGVTFRSRIATLIYVNIGQPAVEVELTDLVMRTAGAQTQIVASLKSTGRRTVRTKGTLAVYDAGGRMVREVPVPDVPLLPESERDLAITAVDPAKDPLPLAGGEYRVELRLDLGLPAVIVGEMTFRVQK